MRVIHGKYKGFRFPAYHGANTRPSTELAKESLFNVIEVYIDIENTRVADIFAGTGNIGVEFLSRGAKSLLSVDYMQSNIQYMKSIQKELQIENWKIMKLDALDFADKYLQDIDLVFADPPYDYAPIHEFVNRILASDWFKLPASVFVIEHVDRLVFNNKHVFLKKQYGNTSFTCFKFVE